MPQEQNPFLQDPNLQRPRFGDNPWGTPNTPPARTPPFVSPGTEGAAGSGAQRYYDRLIQLMPSRRGQALGDASALFGAYASDERANRGMRGNFQQDYDRMMLGREANINQVGQGAQSDFDRLMLAALADRRSAESDAMQKIQQGEYLRGGGANFQPTTYTINGRTYTTPRFTGIEPVATTGAEREAGGVLTNQMLERLKAPAFMPTKFEPRWDYSPTDPGTYSKPGIGEQIGRWGAIGTGGLSVLDMLTRGGGAMDASGNPTGSVINSSLSKVLSKIPGRTGQVLGKVAPWAGAVTGGLGLVRQQGLVNNLLNGATTGASVGTMIMPGIGTGIGAGIGAAAGGLKSLFGKLFGKKKPQAPATGPTETPQDWLARRGYLNT